MPGTKRKSDGSPSQPNYEYWLIKSEPESRIEKGEWLYTTSFKDSQ